MSLVMGTFSYEPGFGRGKEFFSLVGLTEHKELRRKTYKHIRVIKKVME